MTEIQYSHSYIHHTHMRHTHRILYHNGMGMLSVCVCVDSPHLPLFSVEKVLKDISQSSTTLIIESRDCTASPENYRIVVSSTDTPYTELLNVLFSPTIEHDVGGLVAPGSQYTVRVQITSDTVIDERNYTLVNTTTTADPG